MIRGRLMAAYTRQPRSPVTAVRGIFKPSGRCLLIYRHLIPNTFLDGWEERERSRKIHATTHRCRTAGGFRAYVSSGVARWQIRACAAGCYMVVGPRTTRRSGENPTKKKKNKKRKFAKTARWTTHASHGLYIFVCVCTALRRRTVWSRRRWSRLAGRCRYGDGAAAAVVRTGPSYAAAAAANDRQYSVVPLSLPLHTPTPPIVPSPTPTA